MPCTPGVLCCLTNDAVLCCLTNGGVLCCCRFLNADYRRPLILQELLGFHADIICLQEVDEKAFAEYFHPQLQQAGTLMAPSQHATHKTQCCPMHGHSPEVTTGSTYSYHCTINSPHARTHCHWLIISPLQSGMYIVCGALVPIHATSTARGTSTLTLFPSQCQLRLVRAYTGATTNLPAALCWHS